jgi:hypothetical protein
MQMGTSFVVSNGRDSGGHRHLNFSTGTSGYFPSRPIFVPPQGHGLKILYRIQEIITKITKNSGVGQMVKWKYEESALLEEHCSSGGFTVEDMEKEKSGAEAPPHPLRR